MDRILEKLKVNDLEERKVKITERKTRFQSEIAKIDKELTALTAIISLIE